MKTAIIIAIALIVGLAIGLLIPNLTPTGQAITELERSYTTAICNENKCIDVLITCQGNQIISLTPTSDLVELPKDWEDFREGTTFCK